ncbi:P-loop containing nucleoside triphosphate hydrolase protein [Dentipellis sp. KUC8613]|nr:P-loop containing nucleoside triphosphate hydrolase protein [Dentipellis sp. KUC8613]
MRFAICPGDASLDFGSACVRSFWATILPAVLVFVFCFSITFPAPIKFRHWIATPFSPFLTLDEAEALKESTLIGDADEPEEEIRIEKATVPLWSSLILGWMGLVETLVWLSIGCFNAINNPTPINIVRPFLSAGAWFYATLRPIVRPQPTPPFDLFILYNVQLAMGVLSFGGLYYDAKVGEVLPLRIVVTAHVLNLAAVLGLLAIILSMPLAIPNKKIDSSQVGVSISPEDYTSLGRWATFHWIWPLIQRGTNNRLDEKDVWQLSPTLQSRPIFIKFNRIKGTRLLLRLWKANSLDIILDIVLTLVSVVLNYASPFFLKRILDAIDHPSPQSRSQAYIYAFLAFICTIGKAQTDVQHLWHGRRAATRIRTELMASIYVKSLKRRDFSGIVDKDKGKENASIENTDKPNADDPKAGADVGKIVNLMAGDASRIAQTLSAMYLIYGSPLEIIFASIFLYQLLGLSAFAGFLVLILCWPINKLLTRRSIRIQKGTLAARDERMGVLNELIGAVKFIKFFAWEDRWIQRALDAREVEMGWMFKSRFNSALFNALWMLAPIFVSIISFFVYVVQGNELTVSKAFTAIALFSMVRAPLNIVPAWAVQILQSFVGLNRIATYLGEDEVDEQVSSLKRARSAPSEDIGKGFGIQEGTFRWNEVEKSEDKDAKGTNAKGSGAEANPQADTEADAAANTLNAGGAVGEAGDRRFELHDVNVMFPERRLSVVIGPTASGKTALLMALLGELATLKGKIIMAKDPSTVDEYGFAHTISYAAQTPWLRHQSIRDNILFGSPYDEEKYKSVLECCALNPDLDILEDGDETEIGERGVSLSGGQKARVALARAVYAPTKYVLLDDPLSAVDSHTARLLFEKLIQGPLLAHRTIILVTHHVELVLPGAYYLIRMLDGRIDTQGTVADLRAQGVLDDIAQEEEVKAHQDEQAVAAKEETATEKAIESVLETEGAKDRKARKLVKDEERETGGVKWHIYNTYLKASSYWAWVLLGVCIVATQILVVGEKFWIKVWGEAYGDSGTPALSISFHFTSLSSVEQDVLNEGPLTSYHLMHAVHSMHSFSAPLFISSLPRAQDQPLFYIGVYAAIGVATGIVRILANITQYTGGLRASRVLFRKLLDSVVRATMRWHDTTPQGRILNRFSKDIEAIDSSLSFSLQAVNSSLANFAASVITVAVVFPFFLIPAFVIGILYRMLAIGYLNTARDLHRMESNTRSPIFAEFHELLEGIVTVRAFSAEQRFLDTLHTKIDLTTRMWYTLWMSNIWLLLNFDSLSAFAVLVTTLLALSGYVSAGLAGLCITSAMAFTTSTYWACRSWTDLEIDLNSVERVVEYLDLPQEPAAIIESHRPPAYWPSSESNSLIVVEDLEVKYAPELPPVLHHISFSLKGRERVGLLGRTGSGKSTLAMSILRFVDPAGGRILIDGIDISSIGLHDLRSRITFIPQDATLFSGTLRDNLDPFKEHEDAECLDVLHRVHMLTDSAYQSQRTSRQTSRTGTRPTSPTPAGGEPSSSPSIAPSATEVESKTGAITLDTQVSPAGANFSQGQRQLIAMARALLRHSSIIVLDEATSSIDFATDAKIQTTIREEFGGSLLLTVAHRLKTVIDYDRLIVLDKGEIAEFDTPWNLIQKEDGIFRTMCLKSGMFSELEQVARAKAEADSKI